MSWKAIERRAAVVAADGRRIGTIAEVAGDADADIFNGLVVSLGRLEADRYVAAEQVTAIYADRVEVAVPSDAVHELPEYDEPVAERWAPPDDAVSRLRRFLGPFGRRNR